MKYEYSRLLGKIKEVCGLQAIFASKMMLSERTVSLKLNGKREWKQDEISKACDILGIPTRDIPIYFFTAKVQN